MPSKESLNPSLTKEIRRVAEIPNAPFLYEPAKMYLREQLIESGYFEREGSVESSKRLEFAEDDFAFYARIKSGEAKNHIIITGHLDHPYIVLDGKGGGVPLGSIGNERLKALVNRQEIPVHVFSKAGEKVAEDSIVEVNIGSKNSKVRTAYPQAYETNSHAIWNLEPVVFDGPRIKMINSDNMVNTAVMLSLLKDLAKDKELEDVNVEFVFSYLEEIKQVSATGIAMRGSTPFGPITHNTSIIVLESASVESDKTELLQEMKLKPANYNDGLVIRVNDRDIVYGQQINATNKIENLLLSLAESNSINFQHTLLSGTCDATAYSLFSETSNIVGVTIPTKYKHNWGDNGEIVHEEVYFEDVDSVKKLLELTVRESTKRSLDKDFDFSSLSQKLKSSELAPSKRNIDKLKKDRITTYFSSLQRLRRGKFFPESIVDSLHFYYGAGVGKLVRRL